MLGAVLRILIFGFSECQTSTILKPLEKTGPKQPEDPSEEFLEILNMGSTFKTKTRNQNFVLNMGSISSRKYEMEILDP